MKQDNSFIGLLDAMWHRQCALLMMQAFIEEGSPEGAMESHFQYLYWDDEVERLFDKHQTSYWQLKWIARPKD